MRAAVFSRVGPARDVLSVREIDPVPPGPGEVQVRIAASGVNPTDWKERSASAQSVRRRSPLEGLAFKVPNQDGAGTVEAVGEGVDPARIGERVWLYFAAYERQYGTAAELCTLPAGQAVALPEEASFELGASLGIPALTAYHCLLADGPVGGRTVLVTGGAGAVGHYAIQLARWAGAERVIATVSSEQKAALARAAGAHAVVDYRSEDAATRVRELAPDGAERIVEVALDQNIGLAAAVAAPNAAIAAYATTGAPTSLELGSFMSRNVTLRAVLIYTIPPPALREAIDEVSRALDQGALGELPLHRFPLERIADAHDAVEGGAVGKVLVDPGA
jgi:NADPH2:quinone reductase